jgi:hypothetical protein
VHEIRISVGTVGQDDAEHKQSDGAQCDEFENCGYVVALLDARLKRERDSHAEDEKEAEEDHVHVRHRVDLARGA